VDWFREPRTGGKIPWTPLPESNSATSHTNKESQAICKNLVDYGPHEGPVRIWNRTKQRTLELAKDNNQITAVNLIEEAVNDADIICLLSQKSIRII
jgi:hypothetical protein